MRESEKIGSDSPRSDNMIEKVAQAIEQSMIERLYEKISQESFEFESYESDFLSLRNESDRSLVLFSFIIIDDIMCKLLRRQLNIEITDGTESLFSANGPLSTANARIEMSAAIFWINKETYMNLRTLRRIRNIFAHDRRVVSLSDQAAKSLLDRIPPYEEYIMKSLIADKNTDQNKEKYVWKIDERAKFFSRSVVTCAHMISDLMVEPVAQRMGLTGTRIRRTYDTEPEILKKIYRSSSYIILTYHGL